MRSHGCSSQPASPDSRHCNRHSELTDQGLPTNILKRNNVVMSGCGFGCDQQLWRFVAPAFEATHLVVLFDPIGCGKSDMASCDKHRHASLAGYASDMIDILAVIRTPQRVARLVLVGPSPRHLNDPPGYVGGFDRADIDGLMDMMESNMVGWADFLAPAVMGEQSPLAPPTHPGRCNTGAAPVADTV